MEITSRFSDASALTLWFRKHPEWWMLLISFFAWVYMGYQAVFHEHHRHASVLSWLIMISGMMLPFLTAAVRRISFRSYYYLRHISISLFLIGFMLVWCFLYVILDFILPAIVSDFRVAPILYVLAAIWLFTPVYRKAIWACHGDRPLAASGYMMAISNTMEGARFGLACLKTSALVMLACSATNHSLIAMLSGLYIEYLVWTRRISPLKHIAFLLGGLALWSYIIYL